MHLLTVPRDVSPQALDVRSLYTFHEVIGTGRTGTVYRCTNIQSQEIVAIKVIKARDIHGFNEYRLCQWIETLVDLDIKGIVKFYKMYTNKSHQLFYVIMKHYVNGNLTTNMSGDSRCKWAGVSDERISAACSRLLSAIAFLHNQLWLTNTTTVGVPLGAISTDNILLDDDFSFCLLPGIGAPMNWAEKTFSMDALNKELLTLAPEKVLTVVRQHSQPNAGTQTGIPVSPISKNTKSSANKCLTADDLQKLMKHRDTLLKPTFAADAWALGCLLFAIIFQKYPFRSSDVMHLSYALPEKAMEAATNIPEPISAIVRGLLVVDPSNRTTVLHADNILSSFNGKSDRAADSPMGQAAKANEKLYIAQLKYIVSTMDESLAKLSALLSSSVSAQTEAQEEVTRLSALQASLEEDVRVKNRTIQQLKCELKKTMASMKVSITRADEIDTNSLTNEELASLEGECKKVQDKIANTRLLRCSPECVVCLSRPKSIKLDPCKHVCICHECYVQLLDKRCPICRAAIIGTEKVFL